MNNIKEIILIFCKVGIISSIVNNAFYINSNNKPTDKFDLNEQLFICIDCCHKLANNHTEETICYHQCAEEHVKNSTP